MRLASFTTPDGRQGVGVVVGERIREVSSALIGPSTPYASPMRRLLFEVGTDLAGIADEHLLPGLPLADVRLAPIVPDPGRIVAAPVNYRDHQSEMQEDAHISALGFFLKSPSSVLANGGVVRLPYSDRRFDHEGEFALVIGRTARDVPPEHALAHVAGYTLLLDMTMRGGEDRSTRKSFDTFTPVGPYLVTPDEAGPIEDLVLRCWVNDDLRQQARLRDLIWDAPKFIAYASSVTTLQPGDILTTGTPAGIGQVRDGDRVAVEIDPIGRLEVAVRAEHTVPSPTLGANRGPKPPAEVTPVAALV